MADDSSVNIVGLAVAAASTDIMALCWNASNSHFSSPMIVVGLIVSQGMAAAAAAVPSIMAAVVASLALLLSASSTPSAISDSHPDSSKPGVGGLHVNVNMLVNW